MGERYSGDNYSLERAKRNIGKRFWQTHEKELLAYAKSDDRVSAAKSLHEEWDKTDSPTSTTWRLEWAAAIYDHGDWAGNEKGNKASAPLADRRQKYPAEYRCDNGTYVRSLSELFIADWLYANRITFEYEREVRSKSEEKSAYCDFYIPDWQVYVEFWGMEEDMEYLRYKKWKEQLYQENNYKLVSLNLQDLKTFRDAFARKLKAVNVIL